MEYSLYFMLSCSVLLFMKPENSLDFMTATDAIEGGCLALEHALSQATGSQSSKSGSLCTIMSYRG